MPPTDSSSSVTDTLNRSRDQGLPQLATTQGGEHGNDLQELREAVARNPSDSQAWNNLGHACFSNNLMDEAIAAYSMVSQLLPEFVAARTNRGTAHVRKLELAEARKCYLEALQYEPADSCTHWNSSLLSLFEGNFEDGFLEYEWRFRQFPAWQRGFQQPRWDGFNIAGKTILLHAEQGFGDTIQFSRFIPWVAATGAKVVLECHRELVGLLRQVPGISQVVANGDPLPAFDVCSPLMSLPLVFKLSASNIPAPAFSLKADVAKSAVWNQRLGNGNGSLRVGIVWAGSKDQVRPAIRAESAQRFASLSQIPGVKLISLQKSAPASVAQAPMALPFLDYTNELHDWTDTAALISNLDLVIGVDTAVIHLAASMGKPTWTLLPFSPDWRWQRDRSDSPWYPTMRLFRQPQMGDWNSVFDHVASSLATVVANARSTDQQLRAMTEHGITHLKQGKNEEAEAVFRSITEQWPGDSTGHNGLGVVLHYQGREAEAIQSYQTAVGLDPDNAEAWNNLGHSLTLLQRFEEATACWGSLIALRPESTDAYKNLGVAYTEQLRLAEARSCYERALALDPNDAGAHWNLSHVALLQGDFERGFREYELRFSRFPMRERQFPQPKWDGFDIAGNKILLHAEQGFGDTIQFARLIPKVAERGATIILECHPELVRLFGQIPNVAQIVARGEPLPAFDIHASLLSLPGILGVRSDKIPAPNVALAAEPALQAIWKQRLDNPQRRLLVGIVWSGSSDQHRPVEQRESAIRFATLANIPGVQLISLQKHTGSSGVTNLDQLPFIDLGNMLNDWADTAAIIANLDLVIGVDTGVIHLAATMGKPTWTLLAYRPDWRWQLGREDSPWYPTMRLFRQPTRCDWNSVFERVAQELSRVEVASHRA